MLSTSGAVFFQSVVVAKHVGNFLLLKIPPSLRRALAIILNKGCVVSVRSDKPILALLVCKDVVNFVLLTGTPFDLDITSSSVGLYKHTYNLTWTVKTFVPLDETEISYRKTVIFQTICGM